MEVQVLKDALQRMQSEMVDMRRGIGFAVPMVKAYESKKKVKGSKNKIKGSKKEK